MQLQMQMQLPLHYSYTSTPTSTTLLQQQLPRHYTTTTTTVTTTTTTPTTIATTTTTTIRTITISTTLQLHYNYNYNHNYNYNITTSTTSTTLQIQLQLQLYCTSLHRIASCSCGWGDHCNHSKNHNHLSVHQWIRSAIHASQQLTSPIVSYLWNFHHRLVRYYWYNMRSLVQEVVDVVAELYAVVPSPSQHAIHGYTIVQGDSCFILGSSLVLDMQCNGSTAVHPFQQLRAITCHNDRQQVAASSWPLVCPCWRSQSSSPLSSNGQQPRHVRWSTRCPFETPYDWCSLIYWFTLATMCNHRSSGCEIAFGNI